MIILNSKCMGFTLFGLLLRIIFGGISPNHQLLQQNIISISSRLKTLGTKMEWHDFSRVPLAWLWFISNLENSHFRLIREDFICSISFQGFRDLGVHDFSSQYMFPRENNMKGPNRPLLFLISNFRRQVYFIMQCWDKDDFLIGG